MLKANQIRQWQERLRAQPEVWEVLVVSDGTWEPTGNFYDTGETAEYEAAYWRTRGRAARVDFAGNIHTKDLAKDRWG